MQNSLTLALFAPILAFGASIAPRDTSYACNNSPDLCSRSYSSISQLGAHDSPFLNTDASSSDSFSFTGAGNQNVNSTAQLTAGVRLLSAQVHLNNGALHLCHSSCSLLDAGTLSSWLSGIKIWLDANPHEVVTLLLVNSDNASPQDLDAQFKAANIASYGYIPSSSTTPSTTWPTLQEMISANTRLVTFIASLPSSSSTAAPYLLDEFTFLFENNYNVTSPTSFTCTAERPSTVKGQTTQAVQTGRLPLVNHFLYKNIGFDIQAPDTGNITSTNAQSGTGSLGEAATTCSTAYGRQPAFLLVDFFDQGETLKVVDELNGITPVGRGEVDKSAAGNAMAQTMSHGVKTEIPLFGSGLIGAVGLVLLLL